MKKLLGLIGLVAIGGIFGLYLFRNAKPIGQAKKDPVSLAVLKGLEKQLKAKSEIRKTEYVDWIFTDSKSVPLKSWQFVLLTKDFGLSSDELMKVDAKFLETFVEKVTKYYQGKGFSLSEQNTSFIPNDLWLISLGFEKDGVYCVNNFAKQSDPFAYLSCGTFDLKQEKLQKELNSVYEGTKKEVTGPVPLIFRVQKMEGGFAIGSASSVGGWMWIAKKESDRWQVVWSGQDIASCLDMEKYGVPKSIYGSCYDEITKKEH